MKKNDWILTGIILGMAVVFFGLRGFFSSAGAVLEITVEGKVYGTYALNRDQRIEIGKGNICHIEDGKAEMIWADCPDQICVHHRAIDTTGETIVCLPNQVVLSVNGGQEKLVDASAS